MFKREAIRRPRRFSPVRRDRSLIWLSENKAVSDPERNPEQTMRKAIRAISEINVLFVG